MLKPTRSALFAPLLLLVALPLAGQETSEPAEETVDEVEDVIVVTASRTEQRLNEVPAAMTVISSEAIDQIPSDDFGDILRNVPGLNVSQMSARDVQITGRTATFSLASYELVLLDGRTLYLDFFGFVMWDYVPLDPKEIKQVEVVRGPGSAVWGANAFSGVINLLTKRPREMQGTSLTAGAGSFGTSYASVTHAGVSGKLGYRVSGSYYEQDPYDRPTGSIPGSAGPTNPGGTPYPPFANEGTQQPKANLVVDYDQNEETLWSLSAGWAKTSGIMHSGIGPFSIDKGSTMNYVKGDWSRRAARASFYVNSLDGDADNLLTVGIDGRPIAFAFASDTYHLEYSDTRVLGESNIITYGGNARRNEFDLSIAPAGDKREEYGVFVQDEVLIGDKLRWLVGARWDDIDPMGSVVSPRTSLLYSPNANNTFRVSYNKAFKAPSMIQNFLDLVIVNQVTLPTGPYIFPTQAVGNPDLQEEQLDAYEIGYVGTFDKATVTAAVYRNEVKDSSDFYAALAYTSQFPPPGFPLPPFVLEVPPPFGLQGLLPAQFSYRNIGEIVDEGVELSLNLRPTAEWSAFFNYSYQAVPESKGIDQVRLPNGQLVDAVNRQPQNRLNLGLAYNGGKYYVNGNLNFVDDAFWTDVLDSRFWGPTESYAQVNLGAGVYLLDDRMTLSVTAQNVFDKEVLQHVFGDIIGRKVTGQLLFRF